MKQLIWLTITNYFTQTTKDWWDTYWTCIPRDKNNMLWENIEMLNKYLNHFKSKHQNSMIHIKGP